MLSAEDNELLTRTGPGTPMGDLFRRFWMPALLSRELPEPDCPPVRVTVLGEELVAFRDSEGAGRPGRAGVPAPRRRPLSSAGTRSAGCAASTTAGSSTSTGRLRRHADDAARRACELRARRASPPTRPASGATWSGPIWARRSTSPSCRELEFALLPPAHRFVTKKLQECNWAQACEGALDTAHFSFLHAAAARSPTPARARRSSAAEALRWMKNDPMPVFKVVEHERGCCSAASRRADGEDLYWRVTQFLMPNHSLAPGAFAGSSNCRPDLGADRRPELLGLRL